MHVCHRSINCSALWARNDRSQCTYGSATFLSASEPRDRLHTTVPDYVTICLSVGRPPLTHLLLPVTHPSPITSQLQLSGHDLNLLLTISLDPLHCISVLAARYHYRSFDLACPVRRTRRRNATPQIRGVYSPGHSPRMYSSPGRRFRSYSKLTTNSRSEGRERVIAHMESQCWLRRGREMGCE